MKIALASCLASLVSACSLSQPHLQQNARAPAGWEAFCFPMAIAYLPSTDRVSPETERVMPALYDAYLRQTEWLLLSVSGGANASDRSARELAYRRARSALRLFSRLGTPPRRVEVRIFYSGEVARRDRDVDSQPRSPDTGPAMDWAADVVTMIPPEQVERNRARQRESPGLVFC